MDSIVKDIEKIVGKDNIFQQVPTKDLTTFRVGGPCDILVEPEDEEALISVYRYLNERGLRHMIVGNGSNFFVSDQGYRGVFLKIGKKLSNIEIDGTELTIQAGATNYTIGEFAIKEGLSGFEFCAGIPGTIGGAVFMNAGAYGGEIKDVIKSARVLFKGADEVVELSGEELSLSYRNSIFHEKKGLILSVKLNLKEGNSLDIREYTKELMGRRKLKQPLEYPSAGSFFKRPTGYYAGKLIEDAGLRGFKVGDAQVSEKHCGFVINRGNATAEDLLKLRDEVSKRVKREFGVDLEMEVRIIGEYDE